MARFILADHQGVETVEIDVGEHIPRTATNIKAVQGILDNFVAAQIRAEAAEHIDDEDLSEEQVASYQRQLNLEPGQVVYAERLEAVRAAGGVLEL